MPSNKSKTSKYLFLAGLAYFFLVTVAIVVVYENTYFLAQDLIAQARSNHSEVREMRRMEGQGADGHEVNVNASSSSLDTATQASRHQFRVLVRCILMSAGLILFYVPVFLCMVLRYCKLGSIGERLQDVNATVGVYFVLGFIPAIDVIWTPALVLLFMQAQRKTAIEWVMRVWRIDLSRFIALSEDGQVKR
ncbi:hypothetical protein BC830DRAFT_770646 [Chytriomyces sp. MP71]|nr:hypothetical protein BC830DRAFT_770646 [Chytriomyces sp. MP71]